MNIKELIESIFTNKTVFEKEVLSVKNDKERTEVMRLLSSIIVRDKLKEHMSFLYIEDLSDFSIEKAKNILFKELANEWVSFAIEILDYTQEEALSELQLGDRIDFVHSISHEYCNNYREIIFEEVADTFIELLSTMNQASEKISFVNSVIDSSLLKNSNLLGVDSFNQLHKNIMAAKASKSSKISSLQFKISELLTDIQDIDIDTVKKDELTQKLCDYEDRVQKVSLQRLEHFDTGLQRVKIEMINSLKNKINQFD